MTDPVMNPPAPSGRRDDSELASNGERIGLPAETRMYVDSGGAKHFILPDGTTRYVPPGEVGNFYLEGENPQEAMRRHLVQELPYADAVRVNAMLDNLFGALDEARKLGASLKLVPENEESMPELAKVLERAYKNRPINEYPKAKYHPEYGFKAVSNKDEEGDLGGDWHDTPDDAKAARSGPKATGTDREKRRDDESEGNSDRPYDPRIQDMRQSRIGDTGGVIKTDVAPADKPVATI